MDVIITIHIPGLLSVVQGLLGKLDHGGQAKIANEAGVQRNTVSALKRGNAQGIRFENLVGIARAAGWTLDDLSIPVELLEEGHLDGRQMQLARWLFNAIAVDGVDVDLKTPLLMEEGNDSTT